MIHDLYILTPFNKQPWFNYPQYSWQDKTVTIIGAGIAGCQSAWHLAKSGWKVTVIERNLKPAQEASGNQAGIISPKITTEPSLGENFYRQSFDYALKQLAELDSEKISWHPTGVLKLAYQKREQERWKKLSHRILQDTSLANILQCLSKEEASQVANIPIHYNSLFLPQAGWIKPIKLCATLLTHQNIQLMTHTEVINLHQNTVKEEGNNDWKLLNSSNQVIAQSEVIILCSGKSLDFPEIETLPTIPISGQTSLSQGSEVSQKLKTVIDHKGYITPIINKQKQLLFGATYIQNSFDISLNSHANLENFEKQKSCLPELSKELNELKNGHAAVRITTPDRLPYVGAVPRLNKYMQDYADLHFGRHWQKYPDASYYSGLFISAAYGSHGLTTGGLCANILTSLINKDTNVVSKKLLNATHPARFYIRELKTIPSPLSC